MFCDIRPKGRVVLKQDDRVGQDDVERMPFVFLLGSSRVFETLHPSSQRYDRAIAIFDAEGEE